MKQEARSERSRTQILAAALRLFSSQGYRGTNMREIAEAAGVSTGNVYHQFKDKEALFQTLLNDFALHQASADYPFNKAIAEGAFPDDLDRLANAIRESLEQTRAQAMLVYVDVIEFDGRHLQQFYENLTTRFEQFLQTDLGRRASGQFRAGVSPLTAMLFVTRFLFKYFEAEVLFGVPNPYRRSSREVLAEMADLIKFGLFNPPTKS